MRKQIANRLGVAHIRDMVQQFVAGEIDRHQAMESLQIGKSQLYELRTSYLAAKAAGKGDEWVSGLSGGNHMPQWSEESQKFLRKVLSPSGDAKRYSYAFAASEVGRLHDLFVDRSQVRHWAIEHGVQAPVRMPRPPAKAGSESTKANRCPVPGECVARPAPRVRSGGSTPEDGS